jgi:hypothetical protein
LTTHSDSKSQSLISESEDLDLRLQMLIAEARPLLKDLKAATREVENNIKLFKKLEDHIMEVLHVADVKLKEAGATYDLIKMMQDKTESRLEMLMDSMKTAHKLWTKIETAVTNVGANLKDLL